uniref:Uncharacterized protein n=1 Tax=Myoviridae sp. ctOoC8 TaxID=2823542 RepID=A0A8S5L6D3_9CAUD|nr:MAG TPA: hypothetical protein [Myoviridae sp. ctOoC8]
MKKHTAAAIDYFSRHHSNECHITADGRVFHKKEGAESFASTLEDRTIESFTRREAEASADQNSADEDKVDNGKELLSPDTPDASNTEDNTLQDADTLSGENTERAEKIKELENLELIPKNYNQMKSLASYFKLEVGVKANAEDLISVLTEFKSKLEK